MARAKTSKKVKMNTTILGQSNQCLAIVGLFKREDNARFRRHQQGGGAKVTEYDGAGGADEFFRVIGPELRATTDETIQVGDQEFNSYDIGSPLTKAEGQPQPIHLDSPLLTDEAYSQPIYEKIQKQGADLFQKLLENLDVVSKFWSSRFPKTLVKIAQHYTLNVANDQLRREGVTKKHLVSQVKWEWLVAAAPKLTAGLVKYLTCPRADEPATLTEIKLSLRGGVAREGAKLTDKQVGSLLAALEACKTGLLNTQEVDDNTHLKDLADEDGFGFLNDYAADPDYGLASISQVGDKRFASYYGRFIRAVRRDPPVRPNQDSSLVSVLLAGEQVRRSMAKRIVPQRRRGCTRLEWRIRETSGFLPRARRIWKKLLAGCVRPEPPARFPKARITSISPRPTRITS